MTKPTERSLNMLTTALSMEEKGKAFYQEAIEQCGNDLGQEIFRKLKADEDIHVARIKSIYASLTDKGTWSEEWKSHEVEHEDLGAFFRTLAKKHGTNIQADTGDIEALDVGIDFEQKAVTFYREQLKEASDALEREFIQCMVTEEKGHHAALTDMKMYLENPEAWFQETERSLLDGA
jgi:rubrerythrin